MKFLPDKPPRICPWCSAASFATWPEECRLLPSASRWTRALLTEPAQPAAFSPPWQRVHGRRRGRLSCSASATDFSSRTFHLCGVSADPLCLGPEPATLVPKTPFPETTSAVPRTRMSRCRTTRCCCCFPMMTSASLKRNTILGFEKSFLSSKQKTIWIKTFSALIAKYTRTGQQKNKPHLEAVRQNDATRIRQKPNKI